MSDQFIRNREGKIVGKQDGNTLRDGNGRIIAIYHEGDDRTRNRQGRIVGSGDQRLRELEK
jgi:hypothetical protein